MPGVCFNSNSPPGFGFAAALPVHKDLAIRRVGNNPKTDCADCRSFGHASAIGGTACYPGCALTFSTRRPVRGVLFAPRFAFSS